METGILVGSVVFGQFALEIVGKSIDVWEPFEDELIMFGSIPAHVPDEADISEVINAALSVFRDAAPAVKAEFAPHASFKFSNELAGQPTDLCFAVEVVYSAQELEQWRADR